MQPNERYRNDPVFRNLVDFMQHYLEEHQGLLTPTELREAVILAATLYDSRHIKPLLVDQATSQILPNPPYRTEKEKLRIKKGWHQEGREGVRLGPDIIPPGHQMPWTPVLWDGEDDPDFHKSVGLERARQFHV